MKGFPPNIYCIECISDNVNSTNTLKNQNSKIREGRKSIREGRKSIREKKISLKTRLAIADRRVTKIRTKKNTFIKGRTGKEREDEKRDKREKKRGIRVGERVKHQKLMLCNTSGN